MNKEELLEKIEYLASMPHSSLVEHCIYLENENDNYKAQKYITDFISENGIICEKNKEIQRLQQENKQLKVKSDVLEESNKLLIQHQIQMYEDLDIAYERIDKAIKMVNKGFFSIPDLLQILGDKE